MTTIHCLSCVLTAVMPLNPTVPNKWLDQLCDWLIPKVCFSLDYLLICGFISSVRQVKKIPVLY